MAAAPTVDQMAGAQRAVKTLNAAIAEPASAMSTTITAIKAEKFAPPNAGCRLNQVL